MKMKTIWKYCVVFVGLIAGYLLFGVVANILPNRPIENNIKRTLERGDLADDVSYAIADTKRLLTDNYTDALILNQAYNGGCDSLMTSVLLVPRLLDTLAPRPTGDIPECGSLHRVVAHDTSLTKVYYARYWHGSTFLMRFLLQFTNYNTLRLVFYVLTSLLLLWVCVALGRRLNVLVAASYLLSLLLVNVFLMQLSIQFVPVLVLTLGATLWVLYRVKTRGQMVMAMFVTGSLLAYFDLLTCPMLTWGMPLCVYLLMREEDSLGGGLGTMAAASATWLAGYGATWGAKWLIASAFTSQNIIKDGFERFALRAGNDYYFTRWEALTSNLDLVLWPMVCIALLVLGGMAVFRFKRSGLRRAALCLSVAVPPLLWYLAASNHSYLHSWFTYHSMAVVLFAMFTAVGSLIKLRIEN